MARPAGSRPARPSRPPASRGAGPARAGFSAGGWALLLAASLGAALLLYRPALSGAFLSDDHHYVIDNAFVRELSFENAVRILDPTSDAAFSVSNYAPVQLLLHSAALRVFGDDATGHHVMNVGLHALASVLLVALFLDSGLPWIAALLGGALFLSHPANVEAVAWISQLKSSSSLVLALAALLAYARRPGLATVLFTLALLAKGHAVIALPVAALFEWLRTGRVRWRWIALWAAIFAAYAVVEIVSHERNQGGAPARDDSPAVWLRTVVAIALRYLVMAATSWGVSAFHETEPARRLLDPWFLAGLRRARRARLAPGRHADAAQRGGRLLDLGAVRLRADLPDLPVPVPDGGPLSVFHASRADRRSALRGARRSGEASRARGGRPPA